MAEPVTGVGTCENCGRTYREVPRKEDLAIYGMTEPFKTEWFKVARRFMDGSVALVWPEHRCLIQIEAPQA